MVKSLKDVLAGVKSSKVVKLDHKDMYQWNSPDGLKFIDDKHPVEKHADRVGNGDDVYQGKTKPAKYPKQKNDVYEETVEEAHTTAGSHLVNKGIASFSKRLKEMEDHELKMKKEDDKAKKKLKEENIEEGNKENKAKKNIMIQKLGAGEKKTARTPALRKGRETLRSMGEGYNCNMTEEGKDCEVHGMKECPGYKVDSKGRNLLMDKNTNEAIEIGKALRIGNQYSDSHLAKNKRNPSTIGKPANLLDRANKTIGKLKGSTFMVKKMTEEKEINELNTKTLQDFIAAVPKDITKRAAEFNKNIGNMSVSDIKAATDKVLNRVKAQRQAAEKLEKKPIDEVSPPGLEDWIKSNKKRFVKEYGKEKGMQVLYAKAWKMHGQTESGLTSATNTDYAGPGAAGWTTGRLDVGTL